MENEKTDGRQKRPGLRPNPAPALLSLVIPVYNEQECIPYLRREIAAWKTNLSIEVQVVVVDDGSTDESWNLLSEWAEEDRTVIALALSRNFGHQAAVTAGLHFASGDIVIIIDADLQDPLEVIPEMVAKYEQGYDVVYGKRESREGETRFKRLTAWLFYRLMRLLVWKELPPDAGDFRLVSRRCLDVVLGMGEVHRFLRGMFAWVGFYQTSLPYQRRKRQYGHSKYPFIQMLRFAWTAALSFSVVPIKAISLTGLLVAAFGFGYGVYSIVRKIAYQDTVRGWTAIVVLLSILGGMILVALGVLGEYVAKIFEEIKRRPIFVVRDAINTSPNQHGFRNSTPTTPSRIEIS